MISPLLNTSVCRAAGPNPREVPRSCSSILSSTSSKSPRRGAALRDIDKTFLIAAPMRKVAWTKRFAAGWGERRAGNGGDAGNVCSKNCSASHPVLCGWRCRRVEQPDITSAALPLPSADSVEFGQVQAAVHACI